MSFSKQPFCQVSRGIANKIVTSFIISLSDLSLPRYPAPVAFLLIGPGDGRSNVSLPKVRSYSESSMIMMSLSNSLNWSCLSRSSPFVKCLAGCIISTLVISNMPFWRDKGIGASLSLGRSRRIAKPLFMVHK
jgi:hypothetical protein